MRLTNLLHVNFSTRKLFFKKGIAKLVRYIKVCVFRREKYETYILGSSHQESTLQVGLSEPT